MAKYNGVLPRTPQVRPKSEIDNPKRDDKHLRPFDMESPPPPARVVKMASKTVTSTDKVYWPHNIDEYPPLFSRSLNENAKFQKRPSRKPWEILWWLERFNLNSKLKSLSFDVWFNLPKGLYSTGLY